MTLLIPASAVLLGAVALGESLTIAHLRGMTAIDAGLALIDGRAATVVTRSLKVHWP